MFYQLIVVVVPQKMEPSILYWAVIGSILRISGIVLQWLIWAKKGVDVNQNVQRMFNVKLSVEVWWMQAVYPVIMSTSIGSRLLVSLIAGNCVNSSLDSVNTLCDSYYEQGGINLTLFIEMIFIPILTFCLLRDTRLDAIIMSWSIGIGVCITYCIVLKSGDIAAGMILYMFYSLVIWMDIRSRLRKTTTLVNRLQDTLTENERLAVEAQAIELRAMIGNIAHDLKSVRRSFQIDQHRLFIFHLF